MTVEEEDLALMRRALDLVLVLGKLANSEPSPVVGWFALELAAEQISRSSTKCAVVMSRPDIIETHARLRKLYDSLDPPG